MECDPGTGLECGFGPSLREDEEFSRARGLTGKETERGSGRGDISPASDPSVEITSKSSELIETTSPEASDVRSAMNQMARFKRAFNQLRVIITFIISVCQKTYHMAQDN